MDDLILKQFDKPDEVRNFEKGKLLSIDESKQYQDEVQKITDKSIKDIEILTNSKESEILKV